MASHRKTSTTRESVTGCAVVIFISLLTFTVVAGAAMLIAHP